MRVNDVLKDGTREIYHLGWHRTLGLLDVRDGNWYDGKAVLTFVGNRLSEAVLPKVVIQFKKMVTCHHRKK